MVLQSIESSSVMEMKVQMKLNNLMSQSDVNSGLKRNEHREMVLAIGRSRKSNAAVSFSVMALSLSVLFSEHSHAQNVERRFESVQQHKDRLEIKTNDGVIRITPYSNEVFETSFFPRAELAADGSIPVSSALTAQSFAVVKKPQKTKLKFKQSGTQIEYASEGLRVEVRKNPFQIRYYYRDKALTSEKLGYQTIREKQDFADPNLTRNRERLSFNLDAQEALYGGGARALGMDRRGNRLPLYNKAHYGYEERSQQMNYSIPLVFSSKLYALHFDNAAIGHLDLDSQHDNSLNYDTIGGRKTYHIIAGKTWSDLVQNYVGLTGKQPLPPRWAFGNFASRFGYHTEDEARKVVDQFRAEKIPVDAIIFDLYWFGKDIKGTMGNLAFDPDNFKNPRGMMADFAQQGVKTVLITEPFILTTSQRWQEAVQKGILATDAQAKPFTYDFYFGNTGLIDVFKPEARTWFWNIYKDLANQGAAGVWGDLGEPEVHPSALQHQGASADQVHNVYGHEWARLVAEGYAKDFPQTRPFILMRSGAAGSQRFGLIPWSGDVNRTWGGLRSQMEIALQMGMQGLAYMHSDLGGFAGANLDDELYARWLQYGVFQPVFRPHAQEEVPSEPIFRSSNAKGLARQAIELRYRMLPYNYSLAFENSQTGMPLMRPLMFNEPYNPQLQKHASSYLWGQDFLVQPVTNPGQKTAQIQFPKDTNWFDFYTDQIYLGGSSTDLQLVPEHIPTFVRAGALIPLLPADLHLQSTQWDDGSRLELHYYHDQSVKSSQASLYEDDGLTRQAWERGQYRLSQFKAQFDAKAKELHIEIKPSLGKAVPEKLRQTRQTTLVLHHIENAPRAVKLNGQSQTFQWDAQTKVMQLHVLEQAGKPSRMTLAW
ncbi:glycoside hydrolase family 31 protein [Undibacterium cyanobacteriorum]|uniref:Glycoside hydrolase family 31 protein n=1 Tax=Undibacterium cyanobacteriorum TaxID=3073561 RepID=A0ABY9RHJ3_9BURK|nr:TIM-barrel domain-containing protein [Undibacterium sp. 20NA77.5]WMW79750.1 glycoside hydrolase family 31 protein [Undibacterium sp. 20NA77.5]